MRMATGSRTAPAATALAALALVMFAASACASSPAPVKTPPKTTSPQPTSPSPMPTPTSAPTSGAQAKTAITAVYRRFLTASDRAESSFSAAQAAAILRPYTTTYYLQTLLSGLRPVWRKDEVVSGYDIPHIKSVGVLSLSGHPAALVIDCQDQSHHALAHASTGKVIRSTFGPRHAELYVSLAYANGHWLVGHITFVGISCTS